MATQKTTDHWNQQAYAASAPFVPQLTSKIIEWLSPEQSDIILDLGCGDGALTARIKTGCESVCGLDASENLIQAANKTYGSIPGLSWHLQDCRNLVDSPHVQAGAFTKVFSNAALHWILRDPTTQTSVLRGVAKALKPAGRFVFEMGGAGNVAEVHAALLAAVVHQGVKIEVARAASPWFFPFPERMHAMLQQAGLVVEKSELEYRPTKLTTDKEGGLKGWVRLMGAPFLDVLDSEEQQEAAVREVCDVLATVITREEDGSMWLGYVRLRVQARKR